MTNKEKYSEEIMETLFKTGIHPALINEQIVECHRECNHCKFAHTKYSCDKAFTHWAENPCEPGKIDWNKVPVDTKILVRDSTDERWIEAHFAAAQGNLVTVFSLGRSSWTAMDTNTFSTYRFADIPDLEERRKYLKDE